MKDEVNNKATGRWKNSTKFKERQGDFDSKIRNTKSEYKPKMKGQRNRMAITKDARVFRSQTTKEWDEAACSKASEIRKSMDETS